MENVLREAEAVVGLVCVCQSYVVTLGSLLLEILLLAVGMLLSQEQPRLVRKQYLIRANSFKSSSTVYAKSIDLDAFRDSVLVKRKLKGKEKLTKEAILSSVLQYCFHLHRVCFLKKGSRKPAQEKMYSQHALIRDAATKPWHADGDWPGQGDRPNWVRSRATGCSLPPVPRGSARHEVTAEDHCAGVGAEGRCWRLRDMQHMLLGHHAYKGARSAGGPWRKRTQFHLTWPAGQVMLSLVNTCDEKTKPEISKYFLKRVSINSLKADRIHLRKAWLWEAVLGGHYSSLSRKKASRDTSQLFSTSITAACQTAPHALLRNPHFSQYNGEEYRDVLFSL